MNSKKRPARAILLAVICSLLLTACSSGGGSTATASAGEPQSIPERTTAETKAAGTTAEVPETTEAPATEESVTEPTETEPVESTAAKQEGWRAKYEALPAGLQEALIPSPVESGDDFLAMKADTLGGSEWSGAELANYEMTVIDCWMTWCGPCREEMPTLQKVFMELPESINMMGICFDGKEETSLCLTIVNQSGVHYNILLGDDVNGDPFNLADYTQGVPTLLFVDPQGHCFARFVGRPLTDAIEEKDALDIIIHLALEKLKGE
ncbi:MAG: TlpA family protein disulfide reductase [Lachnospiraceae bacterium]|nr:TlpA family protein disulfide reductase [Lachnospiraceae bacterium]